VSKEHDDAALARIRAVLDASRGNEGAYRPRPCLAEADILEWESEHGVTLPEPYRRFLREVGDGGEMPGSYCDFEIAPLWGVQGGPSAATPFPITAERCGNGCGDSRPRPIRPTVCCSPN
jgi:hypothetical protein